MATTTKQLDSWAVLRDILQREGVARQHLNSYNEFIAKGLQTVHAGALAVDVNWQKRANFIGSAGL